MGRKQKECGKNNIWDSCGDIDMYLLVTGAWKMAKNYIPALESMGYIVTFMQYEKDELPCSYELVEGIICNSLFQHHNIEKFTMLRYIQLTSAGFDRVPMEYINSHNITINNACGVYSIPMAEFAVFSVLQFYKQGKFFHNNQAACKWEKNRELTELSHKKICILGCGSVGKETAKKFFGFTDNIIGVDLCNKELPFFKKIYPMNKLNMALDDADVIVLALPLTSETYHLFDRQRLSNLKEGCVLINIARGGLIDSQALKECLERQRLFAALDVFETEPLDPIDVFWKMSNVIITPHNSFVGDYNEDRLQQLILNNLKDINND